MSKADPDGHADGNKSLWQQFVDALNSFGNELQHAHMGSSAGYPPPQPCACPSQNKQDNKSQNNNNSKSSNQNESGGQGKKVPNPNGKNGDAAHQEAIGKVEKDMQERGLTTQREYKVKTPGGEKSSRYVDVVGKDGEVMWWRCTRSVGRRKPETPWPVRPEH